MRKITLFYDGAWYTFKWLKAMLWAKNEFRELGYDISFLNREEYLPSKNKVETFENNALNYEYDIVFIVHHSAHIGLCSIEFEKFADLMQRLRKNCNKIVWCDTHDSSGNLWVEAFPFVDLYFKKQVYADLNRYTQKMCAGRLYAQFYLDKMGGGQINDNEIEYNIPITDDELKKLRISWNVGLGELFEQKDDSYRKPYDIVTPQNIKPSMKRKYDVQYKGTMDYSICGYQRLKSAELISQNSELTHSDVFSIIPYDEYLQEIAESKSVISPYGWGEICTRDFEAFLQGATLIKPDMSHLVTFPNWYIENKTYIATKWDFSDFTEVVEKSKTSKEYIEIAQNAQELFIHHRCTKAGRRAFAEHIIQELEK